MRIKNAQCVSLCHWVARLLLFLYLWLTCNYAIDRHYFKDVSAGHWSAAAVHISWLVGGIYVFVDTNAHKRGWRQGRRWILSALVLVAMIATSFIWVYISTLLLYAARMVR